jgi:lipoprotein-anchoring transpeptidase ErfK/SrfK
MMPSPTRARSALAAAAATLLLACASAQPASAQLLWDWGGGSVVGDSGRQVVSFNPQFPPGQIIVSFGDRRLYLVTSVGEAISYPIAIPREEDRWQGVTAVTNKRVNPSWTPTPTMLAENPRLPRWVPGGHPMNPLGVRALYLGSSFDRIHGTDAPWTIGTAVSKGCIRMYNQDVLDLYPRVSVGAVVTVTWDKFEGSGRAHARAVPAGDRLRPMEPSDVPRRF